MQQGVEHLQEPDPKPEVVGFGLDGHRAEQTQALDMEEREVGMQEGD